MIVLFVICIIFAVVGLAGLTAIIIFSIHEQEFHPIIGGIALVFSSVFVYGTIFIGYHGPIEYETQLYTVLSMEPEDKPFTIVRRYEYHSRYGSDNGDYYYFHQNNMQTLASIKVSNSTSFTIKFSDEISPSCWEYKTKWNTAYKVFYLPTDTVIDIR